ncbi:MAG: TetR/AcrR family transcriptional regulator [Chloroflexi bacterium]|nr:TetR/AcrR family transcriptional regulator [Chloroflexota bacterium]
MPRPDVSEERRPQIVEAAIRVFLRKGYRKATMPDVAREAGLSVGGVYWYFKGKDEIVLSILDQVFQSDLRDLNSLLDLDAPTAERVRTYIVQYVKHYDDYSWLDPVGIQFYAESVHDPKVRGFISKYLSHYRQALVTLIEQGIRRGEFKQVDSLDVANSILGLEEGLSMLTVADQQNVHWKESFQTAIELILTGLIKKETEK